MRQKLPTENRTNVENSVENSSHHFIAVVTASSMASNAKRDQCALIAFIADR